MELTKITTNSLKTAIRQHWPDPPSDKTKRYVGQFFNQTRTETKISAQVQGNDGIYTVSIHVDDQGITSACSCYIGKDGDCHHYHALAITFLNDTSNFRQMVTKKLKEIQSLDDLKETLQGITLEALLKHLAEQGMTQKAAAESIGMSPRHLSVIKSSELRNRFFHELGATKLACLWILEHLTNSNIE